MDNEENKPVEKTERVTLSIEDEKPGPRFSADDLLSARAAGYDRGYTNAVVNVVQFAGYAAVFAYAILLIVDAVRKD